MVKFNLFYKRDGIKETFGLNNAEGSTLMHPQSSGFCDFLGDLVDEHIMKSADSVEIVEIGEELPEYYGNLVDSIVKMYNAIPVDRKPLKK